MQIIEVIIKFPSSEKGISLKRSAIALLHQSEIAFAESVIDGVNESLDSFSDLNSDQENHLPLSAYFQTESAYEIFVSQMKAFPEVHFERHNLDMEATQHSWRSTFDKIETSQFLVVPKEKDVNAPESKTILKIIDGDAFGTGQHATTEGCLRILESYEGPKVSFLDIGCGSGLLPIAAAKLHFKKIAGTEIDPDAIVECLQNLEINNTKNIEIRETSNLSHLTGQRFEFIVANILVPVLHEMITDIVNYLAPNGTLVLSGFINKEWLGLKPKVLERGLTVVSETQIRGWLSIRLRN